MTHVVGLSGQGRAVLFSSFFIMLSCSERTPPPVVVAPPEVVDAGRVEPAEVDPPIADNVQQVPDSTGTVDDPNRPEALMRQLLRDPRQAEATLAHLDTPTQWQVALLAAFAHSRGDNTLTAQRERQLPPIDVDGGVTERGKAWVGTPTLDVQIAKGRKLVTVASLPLGAELEVTAIDGGMAQIAIELASAVEYGPEGSEPTHVETTRLEGQVNAASLLPTRVVSDDFTSAARAQPDTDEGHDLSVALWYRALLVDHSEPVRRGLLEAAWAAHRPSWVVTAALDRTFSPVRGLVLSYGCLGTARHPPLLRWPVPKTPPANACVFGVDEQMPCEGDAKPVRTALERNAEARANAHLTLAPALHFTVDARRPRWVMLAQSKLETVENCSDFREVKVEGWGASLRRLHLPLGLSSMRVRVPVTQYSGVEYAVVSAASETKIGAWLRTRSHNRWTVEPSGGLSPSLQNGDTGFQLEPDVSAETWAVSPLRTCDCD